MSRSWRRCFVPPACFAAGLACLFLVWRHAPAIDGRDHPIALPHNIEELKGLAEGLGEYRDRHPYFTLLMFSAAYLFKQTFAIPGSFFMNLLAGALFGPWLGILVVTPLTAVGASFCYTLSAIGGAPLVDRCFATPARELKKAVLANSSALLYFLLCARVFPLTPHWLLNILSPYAGVPIALFAVTVFLGILPYNTLCCRAGAVLSEIKTASDVLDTRVLLELGGVAAVLFAIAMMKRKVHAAAD